VLPVTPLFNLGVDFGVFLPKRLCDFKQVAILTTTQKIGATDSTTF
jgi:hypothetical protein